MKHLFLVLVALLSVKNFYGQKSVFNRLQVTEAKKALEAPLNEFFSSIGKNDLDSCISRLLFSADNPYKKYIVGGVMYNIDAARSFQLHQSAFERDSTDANFLFEFAIELHRSERFQEAAMRYEQYLQADSSDRRVYVWLADCYINLGKIKKAVQNWTKANYHSNHTGIDFAIHTIYGNSSQLKQRNNIRHQVINGDFKKLFDLLFLDHNWAIDWWNKRSNDQFLAADLELAKQLAAENQADYRLLQAYASIKQYEQAGNKSKEIKDILLASKWLLDEGTFPANGKICSDLLNISLANGLLNEAEFYQKRGDEILALARSNNDIDLLNIYAYLQGSVKGLVNPEIDKLGWTQFKDERFAISYFLGKAGNNRFDDPELAQALKDFPNAAKLHWVKLNCASIEHKPVKAILIEVIKKEFKSLGTDVNHFSERLNSYFDYLQTQPQ